MIESLAQSGLPTFKIIDINTDQTTIREASQAVKTTLQQDPHLTQHKNVQNYLTTQITKEIDWSQVG